MLLEKFIQWSKLVLFCNGDRRRRFRPSVYPRGTSLHCVTPNDRNHHTAQGKSTLEAGNSCDFTCGVDLVWTRSFTTAGSICVCAEWYGLGLVQALCLISLPCVLQVQGLRGDVAGEVSEQDERDHAASVAAALQPQPRRHHCRGKHSAHNANSDWTKTKVWM